MPSRLRRNEPRAWRKSATELPGPLFRARELWGSAGPKNPPLSPAQPPLPRAAGRLQLKKRKTDDVQEAKGRSLVWAKLLHLLSCRSPPEFPRVVARFYRPTRPWTASGWRKLRHETQLSCFCSFSQARRNPDSARQAPHVWPV